MEVHPDTIQILARLANDWGTAAKRDTDPLTAVVHASYARAFALALREVAEPDDVAQVLAGGSTDETAASVEARAAAVQLTQLQILVQAYPKLRPSTPITNIVPR